MITDCVGKPLNEVIQELDEARINYQVIMTRPVRNNFGLLPETLYVIRQKQDKEGMHILTVAAKMAKEDR